MSSNIQIGNPFLKVFHANSIGTGTRLTGNPAFGVAYNVPVPSPLRRIALLIQNKGTTEIDLTLANTGSTLKLYAGQSISFDNYNGSFSASSYTDIAILESFA
jgi:hypothetical protein